MMQSIPPDSRVLACSAGLAALVAAFAVNAEARAETRKWVDISVGAKAATSPYLASGEDTGAVAITAAVDGALVMEGDVTTVSLIGSAWLDGYLGKYGTNTSASAGANVSNRVSERTSLGVTTHVRTSQSAAQDFLRVIAFPELGGVEAPSDALVPLPPEAPMPDITAAGRGARVNNYFASGFLNHLLSPTKSVGVGINAGYTDTEAAGGQDHWQFGADANYSQRLNERFGLSAVLQANWADFASGNGNDATTLSSLIGVDYRISETTSLKVQAGATWTRFSGYQHVGFAANVNMCRRRPPSSLCASISHDTQPTTFDGVSTVSSVEVGYSLQTSLRDKFSINARYGRTNGIRDLGPNNMSEFYGAAGTYSREIGSRLSAFISSSLTKNNSSSEGGSEFNAQVEAGIRYRVGDLL